jgi:hypothetical protein
MACRANQGFLTQANYFLSDTAGFEQLFYRLHISLPALTTESGLLSTFAIFQSPYRRVTKPASLSDSQTPSCLRLISSSLPSHTSFLPRPVPKEGGLQFFGQNFYPQILGIYQFFKDNFNSISFRTAAGFRLNRRHHR